jgi:hypothetical protein
MEGNSALHERFVLGVLIGVWKKGTMDWQWCGRLWGSHESESRTAFACEEMERRLMQAFEDTDNM